MIKYVRDNHNSNSGLIGAEIGVKGANNSINILKNLNMNCLYLVDAFKKYNGYKYWDKDYESIAKRKLKKYGDEAVLMVDFSSNAVKQFQDGFFDFIYIDANHMFKHVKQDIELWYPKVKNGGVFGGHDFIPETSSVKDKDVDNVRDTFPKVFTDEMKLQHVQGNGVYRAVMGFVDKESQELNFYGNDWWVTKKLDCINGVQEKEKELK
jgi:hypothetical protein